jgi:hypothetical protein
MVHVNIERSCLPHAPSSSPCWVRIIFRALCSGDHKWDEINARLRDEPSDERSRLTVG